MYTLQEINGLHILFTSSCGEGEDLGDQRKEFVSVFLPVGDILGDRTPHLSMVRLSQYTALKHLLLLSLKKQGVDN